MSLRFATLCCVLILSACSSTKRTAQKGFYAPDQPKFLIQYDADQRKDGKETWWYPDGKKKYEAANRAGFREGKFTAWHPNGVLWYEGYEHNRKPESTLTYWYPNGKMKSQALFRDGIQLERKDWDEQGALLGERGSIRTGEGSGTVASDENSRLRDMSLRGWALRVRQTVESYWRPGRQFDKEASHKAIAKIKVDRAGKVLGVTWIEKSGSAAFNSMAQQTFRKIKRMPEFPPQIRDETLEIQYEFVSKGKAAPRRKLELREPALETPGDGE